MMRDGKEEAREKEGGDGSPTSIVRLTGRDKELMWHVATARYRRLQQLKKIVFVRSLNGKEGRRSERQRGGGRDRPSVQVVNLSLAAVPGCNASTRETNEQEPSWSAELPCLVGQVAATFNFDSPRERETNASV